MNAKKIINFIQHFINIITSEDKQKLIHIHERMQYFENLNIIFHYNGLHYDNCVIIKENKNNDEIDGCKCNVYDQQKLIDIHDAQQIMQPYFNS